MARSSEDGEVNISALVDVAFLLLIYFLVTSTLLPKEGDLSMRLPTDESEAVEVDIDPMMLSLDQAGAISIEGEAIAAAGSDGLSGLVAELTRYQAMCDALDTKPFVVISADDRASHQSFTDVMNSLAEVGIREVTLTDFR